LTICIAFGVSCFGKELGQLLAKKEFSQALYLIPIFTIGYIFYQLSFAYLRNFGFTKKTQYMTITILFSGISNIVMNYFLIKPLGELGAAISFVFSYIFMTLLSMVINKYFVKLHSPPLKNLLLQIFIIIPFYFLLYFILGFQSFILEIIFKIFIFILSVVLIFWTEREQFIIYYKKLRLKH
jgi:O-antigen/teichoic acid export membrane protein